MDGLAVVSCGVKAAFVPRELRPARHILLSEVKAPGLVRFLSVPVKLADGAKTSWETVTRTGKFTDPRYGEFEITRSMLLQMVANFDKRVLGQDVFIDVAHKPNDGAAARVLKLAVEDNRLRALMEWTPFGIDAVKTRGFTYLSAEYHEDWRDNEKGAAHGCVLIGAGLTTRPVIKNLDPIVLSAGDEDAEYRVAIHPNLLKALTEHSDMNKHLKALLAALKLLGLTDDQAKPLMGEATKLLGQLADDDATAQPLIDTFTAAGKTLSETIKQLAASGQQPGHITLQVAAPAIDVDGAVKKALAAAEAQAAAAKAAHNTKLKLFSDTVGGNKTLSEEAKADIVKELSALVTAEMSDDQVKRLAEFALGQAAKTSAAAQLALLGYRPPSGTVHLSVDSSNQIKSLQQEVDKRLGFETMPAARRYERTGGQLLAANKEFAEKVLAQYDAERGMRLAEEGKMLAAGTGRVSDTAVPTVFERTVLREALYNLVGLNFVDVGTAAFANTISIPYSYRDTTAAGINGTRVYEGQAINRAGVIQTAEEARPIPQKLAMRITNEMGYLLAAAPIDFDPLAENTRNVIRVVGEDTDRMIQNEVLQATDEASTLAVNDTLTAQVNGTNRIFVLTQFPILRPRRVFDLQGNQVGSTQFPIAVTLNGTPRTEYTGGTLAAGLYWVMDYNLGEIRFVNEAGVLQTPTNGWALTITATASTNRVAFNLDVGSSPDTINAVYDRLLTSIGGRKVVIENDRYYTASMLLMSGAVDNALGQATTFTANGSRPGTGMSADGSVATVKGMPVFNTRAPGLNTGDARILVGERGNTRFRMLRAFQMSELSQARDAQGNFIGMREGYGEQFVVCHTPLQRKNAMTSIVLFSQSARVARAA